MERLSAFHSICKSHRHYKLSSCQITCFGTGTQHSYRSATTQLPQRRLGRFSAVPRRIGGKVPSMAIPQTQTYKDVQYATLLSEMAYRAVDCGDEASWRSAKQLIESEVGCSLPNVQRHKSGGQRYLVAETECAVYVAFQGTKHVTDWLANLNFIHAPVWHRQSHSHNRRSPENSQCLSNSCSRSSQSGNNTARAHVGFIRRANQSALSISAVHKSAAAAGKRLVLTGHSLGGAVATLTTVQLLRSLHTAGSADGSSSNDPDPQIRCISFATPAVANTSLLQEVTEAGWDKYITNIVLPEDPVVPFVNLLLKAPAYPQSAEDNTTQRCSSHVYKAAEAATDAYAAVSMAMSSSTAALSRSSSSESFSLDSEQYVQQRAGVLEASGMACWNDTWQPHSKLGQFSSAVQLSSRAFNPILSAAAQSSDELAGWLAAAQGTAQQQRQALYRSLSADSSDLRYCYSSGSLQSLQSGVSESSGWSTSDSVDSLASYAGRLETDQQAACSSSRELLTSNTSDAAYSLSDTTGPPHPVLQPSTASRLIQRMSRFNFSKARLAVITGALAAGMRCAAALAAPQLLSQHASLVSMLPGALSTPLAVVAVQLVGTFWLKSALPVTHPLGQQWVMTGSGIEQVAKPLKAYPKAAHDLGLQQLGGFAPGHRMIAYRRRLVKLMQKQSLQ